MANKALFISEKTIKDASIIFESVDSKYINAQIIQSQDLKIHPILGTGLYKEIESQILADSLTALNITLLEDYVQPALKADVIAELPLTLNFKLTNKAVSSTSGDQAQASAMREVKMLMDELRNKAEFYAERVTKYLVENCTDYPLYSNPGTGVDVIKPNLSNYTNGMFLD